MIILEAQAESVSSSIVLSLLVSASVYDEMSFEIFSVTAKYFS